MKLPGTAALKRLHALGIAFVVSCAGGAIYAAFHWENLQAWIEKRPGLAAWVQAVFSVVAILVAIWTAERGSREGLAKADAERVERLHAVAGAAANAGITIRALFLEMARSTLSGATKYGRTSVRIAPSVARALAGVEDAMKTLSEIPVIDIPGGFAVTTDVMAIRRDLTRTVAAFRDTTLTNLARLEVMQASFNLTADCAQRIHNAAFPASKKQFDDVWAIGPDQDGAIT